MTHVPEPFDSSCISTSTFLLILTNHYRKNPKALATAVLYHASVTENPAKTSQTKMVDLNKIAEMIEGFSGVDVSSVANTALSLVLHGHIQKYPSPEIALKHTSEAFASLRHFEDAIKKIKGQKEIKPEEKINLSHYR